ncbi:MAG TPA: hypothetical protein VF178_16775 [Gemmatimonadaceae bacterium]
MRKWLRRIRGAVVVGLTWAVAWGLIGGAVMELIVDPHGRIADIWPMVLGIPGFFGGLLFSLVFSIAERRRRFEELSLPRFGAWGAVAGALLGGIGVVAFGLGAGIMLPLALLGAASASGSLALARRADDERLLSAGDDR